MSQLVTTLRTLLAEADEHFHAKRPGRARAAFQALLETAQDRIDRPMAVLARSMLARISMQRHATDEARELLTDAAGSLDPNHLESHGRYRAALARLALLDSQVDAARAELRSYLDWAETHEQWEEVVDAASLLAEHSATPAEGREWIERAIDAATAHEIERPIGALYTHLAALYEADEAHNQALHAHEAALTWHQRRGTPRDIVAASWAVGASALAVQDWPLARIRLEEALDRGLDDEDCQDLLPLALSDLSAVHEHTGDEIEARRLMVRAMAAAREHDLATYWPERWSAMVKQAAGLEL